MSCSWPFIDSAIIPDTALTEMTVSEAAETQTRITSAFSCTIQNFWFVEVVYRPSLSLQWMHFFLPSCSTQLFTTTTKKNDNRRGSTFLVARQLNNLWPRLKRFQSIIASLPWHVSSFSVVRTEQGHQRHHDDDVLHIPPLVHVEQDAEDDDLYKLSREGEKGNARRSCRIPLRQ